MAFLDWYKRDRKLTDYAPGEIRHEEERLRIRENQSLGRLKKLREDQEDLFWQGAEAPSPVRRRMLARFYGEREDEAARVETELRCLAKESLSVAAIRFRLERRLDGDTSSLKKTGGEQVDSLIPSWEDHEVDEDEFSGRLFEVLGKVKKPKGDPLAGLHPAALNVLEVWDKMDRGEIEDLDDAMREARGEKTGGEEE